MAALNIKNVQTGTIALSSTQESNTATITAVVLADSFILIDWQTDDSNIKNSLIRGRLTDTTTVTVDRAGTTESTSAALVRYWVIEFDSGITVTHLTGTGTFNTNISIGSTVDLGKTFAVLSYKIDASDTFTSRPECHGVDIVSTTNFQIKSNGTIRESATDWAVQIIEFDSDAAPVVEAATITMAGVTSATATIGAVTVANTMLIGSGQSDETNGQSGRYASRLSLDDTTTIRASKNVTATTQIVYAFAIDWGSDIDLQTGTSTIPQESFSETIAITALASGSTAKAIAFTGGGAHSHGHEGLSHTVPNQVLKEIKFNSTTEIEITRTSDTASDLYSWQVLDFDAFVTAGGPTASLLLMQQSFRQ